MKTTNNETTNQTITHHCSVCGVEYPDGNNLCHPSAVVESIISRHEVTDYQIRQLRTEADTAMDYAQVTICDLALGEHEIVGTTDHLSALVSGHGYLTRGEARELCVQAITSARAQDDAPSITDRELRTLLVGAEHTHQTEMAADCKAALRGDTAARARVAAARAVRS